MATPEKSFAVSPSVVCGHIAAPPSKSHTLRAILFGTLCSGKTKIHSYLRSSDTTSMINACRSFGATIEPCNDDCIIDGVAGRFPAAEDVIDAGNSGIVLRFCSTVGALSSRPVVITGDASIRHRRPMKPLLDALLQLNVSAESMRGDGFAPIIIRGPLLSGTTCISGEDSQPLSALLVAAAFAPGPIDIEVHNPGELPWIRLTLQWFDRLGIRYAHDPSFTRFHIPGSSCCTAFEYTVPGDFSSAAFPIAAALITGSDLTIRNLDIHDSQGDKELLSVFQQMGAPIDIDENRNVVHVGRVGKPLNGVSVDINPFIDALPILAVVACYAAGTTVIRNAAIARHKECNRIASTALELRKMGASITETADGLVIYPSRLVGTTVFSHHDHRLAMALTVAAMGATSTTTVQNVACISKTFPSFLSDLTALGASIEEVR